MDSIRNRPNLIFDVLLHVISLADIATQSRVMKTCKSLYRYGARELLRSIEVHIPTEAKLHSFLLFMHADPSVRIPCLRGLSIYREIRISSQTRTLLTDLFLRLAESERSVFWYLSLDYAKDLFLADNPLARAVGQLHSLTSVHMYSAGIQAAAVLQLLGKNSHLIDVSIGFQDKLLASSSYTAAQVDPVHLLRFSKDTLKSLTVKNWFLMTRTFTAYPRLRNLTIMGEWVPATPKLRRAFPNLSRLYVYGDPTVSPRHYASRRERNRNDQLVHGSWSTPWNCFLGELVHLYVLAPICHIQHILLEVEDWQSTDAEQLREVMADVRPEHLEFIPLELRSGETLLHDDWLDALSERRDPRLKVLQIDLEVLGDDEHADLGQALDALHTAVVLMDLVRFRLSIQASERTRGIESLETCLRTLDVHEYAHRIKETTPSMEVVSIALYVDRTESWKTARVGTSKEDLFDGGDDLIGD